MLKVTSSQGVILITHMMDGWMDVHVSHLFKVVVDMHIHGVCDQIVPCTDVTLSALNMLRGGVGSRAELPCTPIVRPSHAFPYTFNKV